MPSPDAPHGDAGAFGYVVANPYGLGKGERIFSWEEDEWFEGDAFGPSELPPDMVEWLIDEGILVRATAARGEDTTD